MLTERTPADQIKPGDQIVLTVSSIERTPTGYVMLRYDAVLHASNLSVLPPDATLPVAAGAGRYAPGPAPRSAPTGA